MRDDLHKSVPPRTAWARVLRLVQLPERDSDLQAAVVRAVRADAPWLGDSWGRELDAVLSRSDGDFFVEDSVRPDLLRLEQSAQGHMARAVVGIALGLLARDGPVVPGFRDEVRKQALRLHATDCFEQLASRVVTRFDRRQAALVRDKLTATLEFCDLTNGHTRAKLRGADSLDEDLGMPMDLRVR